MFQTDRHQHMGGIQRTGCAGGTTGSRNAQCIQQQQQGFAFNIGEGNVAVAGQSFCSVPVQTAMGNVFQNAANQFISQGCQSFCHFFHFLTGNFRRLTHAHDTGNIFCAGTLFSFLGTAEDQRRNAGAFSDIDGTDAFGCPQFMTAHGKQVDVHFLHIDRHMAHSLYRICMEEDAVFLCDFTDFLDRLNGADLVIGKHHGDQDRFGTDGLFQFFQTDTAKFVYAQICYLHALLFQIFCCMQNGMMFDFCCNDMFLFVSAGIDHASQSHVVTFGTAGCEINFLRFCADQMCYLPSGMFQRFFAFFCNGIYTGCIAVIFSEIRQDRLQHFFSDRCCCRIVHINSCCHIDTPFVACFISYYFYMLYMF